MYASLSSGRLGWVLPKNAFLDVPTSSLESFLTSYSVYLRELIRGIIIRPSIGFDVDNAGLGIAEMSSLRYLLSPNRFRSLTLGGELAEQAERFLHCLSHPESVTYLYIDGTSNPGHYYYLRNSASRE